MSRAFLRDDAEGEMPRRNYALPERDDPEYDRAAARALLEAACVNETQLAERATGYYWGEPFAPSVCEGDSRRSGTHRERPARDRRAPVSALTLLVVRTDAITVRTR